MSKTISINLIKINLGKKNVSLYAYKIKYKILIIHPGRVYREHDISKINFFVMAHLKSFKRAKCKKKKGEFQMNKWSIINVRYTMHMIHQVYDEWIWYWNDQKSPNFITHKNNVYGCSNILWVSCNLILPLSICVGIW